MLNNLNSHWVAARIVGDYFCLGRWSHQRGRCLGTSHRSPGILRQSMIGLERIACQRTTRNIGLTSRIRSIRSRRYIVEFRPCIEIGIPGAGNHHRHIPLPLDMASGYPRHHTHSHRCHTLGRPPGSSASTPGYKTLRKTACRFHPGRHR